MCSLPKLVAALFFGCDGEFSDHHLDEKYKGTKGCVRPGQLDGLHTFPPRQFSKQ